MFCEKTLFYGQLRESNDDDSEEKRYGFGRTIEVQTKKKNLVHYAIKYDRLIHEDEDVVLLYTTHIPNTKEVKCLLKVAFLRSDQIEYRFGGSTKRRKDRKSHVTAPSVPVLDVEKIMLSGILNKNVSLDLPLDEINKDGDKCNSESDEGSNCNIEELDVIIGGDDKDEDDDKVDDKEENIGYIGDWLWNKRESIGDDEEVQGPKEDDHYNGRHGLKEEIGNSFSTILSCIFSAHIWKDIFLKTYFAVK